MFFLLALDGVVDVYVGVDAELLQVSIELIYTIVHLMSGIIKLSGQFSLENIHFSVFEVLLSRDIVGSDFLIAFPVLTTLILPIFHEFLILLQLATILISFPLLDGLNQSPLVICLSKRCVIVVFHRDFKFDQMTILHPLVA